MIADTEITQTTETNIVDIIKSDLKTDIDQIFSDLKNLEKNNSLTANTAINLILIYYIKNLFEEVEIRKNKFKVKV
jgi:hypothetical protein